jgi:Lrp/AsnC family transcriptional regulator for asnA, asnC and gidA
MTNGKKSSRKSPSSIVRQIRDETRKASRIELAGLMHGMLFAYQKVFKNLYGDDASKLYPYIAEEISNVLHSGDDPIIDPSKGRDENIQRCMAFISNDENLKDVSLSKVDDGKYVFEVGECSFGSSGMHDILKTEGVICPFALFAASCLTDLTGNGYIKIGMSDFDDKGSRTALEMVSLEERRQDEAVRSLQQFDDELYPSMQFKALVDDLDLKIIRELRKDGRKSNVEIANALDSSESTVRRRIGLLLDRGVIKGFTTLLHYDMKDRLTRAFINLKVDPTNIENLTKKLSSMKETCSVYKTIGTHNLVCELIISDNAKFQEFMDELQYHEGVKEMAYHIVSSSPKPCPWYGF